MKKFGWMIALALAGCSGNGGTGGGAGGGAGGGGGGGGGAPADAGTYGYRIQSNGAAGIAVHDSLDASFVTVQAVDPLYDGGVQRSVLLDPEGTTFRSPAVVGRYLSLGFGDDAGVPVPIWYLESADGGLEGVSATTVVGADDLLGTTGWGMAVVPHFSFLTQLLELKTLLVTGKHAYDLNEEFAAVGQLILPYTGTSKISGTIEVIESNDVLRVTVAGPPVTFTDASYATGYRRLVCQKAGVGTVTLNATITSFKGASYLPALGTTQKIKMVRTVFCRATPIPGEPPPMDPPSASLTPPPEDPPVTPTESRLLGTLLSQASDVTATALTATLFAPCGRGTVPCEIGGKYDAVLQLVNKGAVPLLVDGEAYMTSSSPVTLGTSGYNFFDLAVTTFQPNALLTFPLQFECEDPGRASLDVRVHVRLANRAAERKLIVDLGILQCGGEGDALMLSDNTRLSRTGSTWTAMPTGITANVIAATDAMQPRFAALNRSAVGYDAVMGFQSRLGWPRIRLQSSVQNGVFTHNGTRYVPSGLTGMPAFAATDTLTVTGIGPDGGNAQLADGGLARVVVAAPPPLPAAAQLFGPRAGLATPIRLPDGTFDVLYVSIGSQSPRGGEGGIFRTVRAADMALDAGVREAPLLDADAIRALNAWGIDAGTVYIAAYRQARSDGFFTRTDAGALAVPVQAGRMIQVSVPDLSP